MAQPVADRGIRSFVIIWFGQLISLLGSGLTGFALGVWVYQRSGSVTQFALTTLSATLPGILMTPLAGLFVDRWDRRWTVILSDTGAAVSTLSIALLLLTGRFELWHYCLALAANSIFNSFKGLAFYAITAMLMPKRHLGRASGMMQIGPATARILSPMIAGLLLGIIQIQGVILVDFATFFIPIITLLLVDVPKLEPTSEGKAGKGSFLQEISYGWTFITARPGVLGLLVFFAIINFTLGLAHALYRPLLLGFASVKVVGLIGTVGGSGVLIGSIVMGTWGGPKHRVKGILGFGLLYGLGLILAGLRPSALLMATAFFGIVFGVPIINGCIQMIWLSKTPLDVQGRVFAVGMMITRSSLPLAYVVAGPLADKVFEPLLTASGPLAGTVGRLIGIGPGRGIGLLYILMGVVTILTATGSYLYPRLRLVEEELPDVMVDKPSDKMAPLFT
jgi:MFS family permease